MQAVKPTQCRKLKNTPPPPPPKKKKKKKSAGFYCRWKDPSWWGSGGMNKRSPSTVSAWSESSRGNHTTENTAGTYYTVNVNTRCTMKYSGEEKKKKKVVIPLTFTFYLIKPVIPPNISIGPPEHSITHSLYNYI